MIRWNDYNKWNDYNNRIVQYFEISGLIETINLN